MPLSLNYLGLHNYQLGSVPICLWWISLLSLDILAMICIIDLCFSFILNLFWLAPLSPKSQLSPFDNFFAKKRSQNLSLDCLLMLWLLWDSCLYSFVPKNIIFSIIGSLYKPIYFIIGNGLHAFIGIQGQEQISTPWCQWNPSKHVFSSSLKLFFPPLLSIALQTYPLGMSF